MLGYLIHGFARRVEDSVARAMSILRAKGMNLTIADPPASNPYSRQVLPSHLRDVVTASERQQSSKPAFKTHREQVHQRQ